MLKIFTDNSSTVRCTEGDDCNVHSSPVTDKQIGNQWRCHVTWWHWFSAVPTTPLYQCALSNLAACRDYWLIFRTAAHWCSLAVITQHCVLESVVGFSRGFSLWHFIKKEILCVRQKNKGNYFLSWCHQTAAKHSSSWHSYLRNSCKSGWLCLCLPSDLCNAYIW